MAENKLPSIIDVTLEKLKTMVNAEVIIGDQIVRGDITIIPVSKVTFGIATGGSDFATKNSNDALFGGGGGAGVTVAPVAFIVIKGDNVRIMPIDSESGVLDKAIAMIPDLIDKIKGIGGKEEYEEPEILTR
jgi:sporulation protein YtfJ